MTPVGYFFVPMVFLCFFTKAERLLSLLVLASVFEASSVFNSSIGSFELGVPPFFVVEAFIALQLIGIFLQTGKILPPADDPRRKPVSALLWFWAWACASAFILPHLFSGMPVYEPRGGIDEQYEALTPLRWSFSNLAQVLYLTLNVCTLIYAVHVIKTREQINSLVKTMAIAVGIVVTAGALQRIAAFGGWEFPYELLNNNPGYSQGFDQSVGDMHRISSTFTEASFAGSFLGAIALGLVAAFLRGRRTLPWLLASALTFLVLLDTTATNGYVAFALGLCLLFFYFNPFRGAKRVRRFLAKGWLVLVLPLLAIAAMVVLLLPDFAASALTVTSQKSDTLSFLHRLNADLTALDIFIHTWGVGVGLGSNRPSSMLMSFLSTVGLGGTILFLFFLLRVIRSFPGKSANGTFQWTFWSLVTLLIAQVVAVPDINRPVLWMLLVLVVVQLSVPSPHWPVSRLDVVNRKLSPRGPQAPLPASASLHAKVNSAG